MTTAVKITPEMIATAPAWRPTPGEKITGNLVHRDFRETEYGTYAVVYIADDESGIHAVHAFHTTLKDGLKALKPKRGSEVSITYLGEAESRQRKEKDGSPVKYHHYVVVDPNAVLDSEDIIWDDEDEPAF